MKLLSIKSDGHTRGALLLGDEVVDFTATVEILEARGEWVPGRNEPRAYHHLEGRYQDALDLFEAGQHCLQSLIEKLQNDPTLIQEGRQEGAIVPLSSVSIGPPVSSPGKILAVGLNYAAHARETNAKLPERPLIFSKCVTALTGPGQPIRLPSISEKIDYEGELAVVIGREARSVRAADAYDYVAGYSIMNDVTARDLQRTEHQWVRAKGLDTFAPFGPWLVTKDDIPDPHQLTIELKVNGETRQRSSTDDLIFKIPEIIAFVSEDLTLRPGDIITTGTPSGVGFTMSPPVFLRAGDNVDITIDAIGQLSNPVIGPES